MIASSTILVVYIAVDVALRTTVIEEAVGVERLSSGFSYNSLASGIGLILAGPINGGFQMISMNDVHK